MQDTPKASGSTRMSVMYLTIGSLLLIWTAIWFIWMNRHPPDSDGAWYMCWGLFFTGLILATIGLFMGPLGRSAKQADVVQTVAGATVVSQPVTAPMPAPQVQVLPNGQVVAAPAAGLPAQAPVVTRQV